MFVAAAFAEDRPPEEELTEAGANPTLVDEAELVAAVVAPAVVLLPDAPVAELDPNMANNMVTR